MNNKLTSSDFKMILTAGSVWGMSEVLMGAWLNGCAFKFTGAIMTGLAFFYMAFSWTATRKILSLLLLLAIAVLFKMFDAVLLSVPITHGSVLNPSFAFVLEVAGFALLISIIGQRFFQRAGYRLLAGAGAALFAAFLFPVAGFFTGSAACLVQGTQIPVSIYTSPLTVVLSMGTVTLGYLAARRLKEGEKIKNTTRVPVLRTYLPAIIFIFCLALVVVSDIV